MTSSAPDSSKRDGERFPGERRTLDGRFTGSGRRLVYVAPDGRIRDCGYPLCGLVGLDRCRVGLAVGDSVEWPDGGSSRQRYLDNSVAIETVHDLSSGTVTRWDVADGTTHLSQAAVEPAPDVTTDELSLAVAATFQPNGRDTRVGQLRFDDVVEIYHTSEHDFIAAEPGFSEIQGRSELPPAVRNGELSTGQIGEHNEEDRLTGTIVGRVPFEGGTASVASLLTDDTRTSRSEARSQLEEVFSTLDSLDSIRQAGAEALPSPTVDAPLDGIVGKDLRVLSLLSAESGLRIAGPDFDPEYHYSGGYGYTWFRDDAEIADHLLAADRRLGLGLEEWHRRTATQYIELQHSDGSWPHRVWPHDGRLAPGWANSRIETGTNHDYQADQTASVVSFLAACRKAGIERDGLETTVRNGLDSLDETVGEDGLPVLCQNAWEDMTGQFTHTAATFLKAYSRVAATNIDDGRAAERATTVFEALDKLWVPERGCYAVRLQEDGTLDTRYDSATLALPAAHVAFDGIDDVDGERLDRLVSHVETVIDGLFRETDAIAGLVRYEDDEWRRHGQQAEKVWTVSTAWGIEGTAQLAVLLNRHDDPRASRIARRATDLLEFVQPGGSLVEPTGYLPEQYFDDGTPDSATPLGWPHAIRTAAMAMLADQDLFTVEPPTAE